MPRRQKPNEKKLKTIEVFWLAGVIGCHEKTRAMVNIFQNSPGRGRHRPFWSAKSVTLIFDDRSPHMILWYWRGMPARTSTILLGQFVFFLTRFVCIHNGSVVRRFERWQVTWGCEGLLRSSASLGRFGPRPGEQTSKTLVMFSNSCVCSAMLRWGLLCLQHVWHCVLQS